VAILIVEQNEQDPKLYHNAPEFQGDFLKVYLHFAKCILGKSLWLTFLKEVNIRILTRAYISTPGGVDVGLSPADVTGMPRIIHAIKLTNK